MSRIISAVLLLITCAALAQNASDSRGASLRVWEPPTLELPATLPRATVPKEMIATLRIANMQIILEQTPLVDVQRRLGGSIGHRGDASEALQWLCFHGKDANGRWALWLESSESGGNMIDGFAWQRIAQNDVADRRCQTLPEHDHGIELPLALRLGLTEAQVRKILGMPTIRYRDILVFEHEHEQTIRSEPYTASNTVYVMLRDGFVQAIQVWKDTSS